MREMGLPGDCLGPGQTGRRLVREADRRAARHRTPSPRTGYGAIGYGCQTEWSWAK